MCPEDLAGELRTWRARMGGTIFSMTTAAVGGLMGLRQQLTSFADYRAWAIELAAALREHGFTTFPEVPRRRIRWWGRQLQRRWWRLAAQWRRLPQLRRRGWFPPRRWRRLPRVLTRAVGCPTFLS